jgi:bacterioferritin (cytochrome b1)
MVETVEQLQNYINEGASLDDIRRLLSIDNYQLGSDSSYQLLNRKAEVLRAIDRLQEPIPMMKVSDAPIIQNIISDLYSQFMMLTELSNVQTIMSNYQENTKEIIEATNQLEKDNLDSYQHLIELIRKYESKEVSSQLAIKGIGNNIVETVGSYLNLEKQLIETLKVMDQARRSNPMLSLITQASSNQILTLDTFQDKIEEYVENHKNKFPLTQIQGILQGARIAFTIAERMRFNSGPYEPINLIELFGVDLIARLIAYAKIEAEFLIQEPEN